MPMTITVHYPEPPLDAAYGVIVVDDDPPRLTSPLRQVEFRVEGRSAQMVVLLEMRAVDVRSREPRPAYSVPWLRGEFNPDQEPMHVYSVALTPGETTKARTAWRGDQEFPYTVTAGDPEVFSVLSYGTDTELELDWRLELDWVATARQGTATIDDRGTPFRCYSDLAVREEPPPAHLHDFLLSRARDPRQAELLERALRTT